MVDEYTLSVTVKAADLAKLPGLFRKNKEVEMLCNVAAQTAKITGNRAVDVALPGELEDLKYSVRVVGVTNDRPAVSPDDIRRAIKTLPPKDAAFICVDGVNTVSSAVQPDAQPNIEQTPVEELKTPE